jgi:hypothetical protein
LGCKEAWRRDGEGKRGLWKEGLAKVEWDGVEHPKETRERRRSGQKLGGAHLSFLRICLIFSMVMVYHDEFLDTDTVFRLMAS